MSKTLPEKILLDLGTRSAKAYFLFGDSILEKQTSWDLLNADLNDQSLEFILTGLIDSLASTVPTFAIGTEAMRRNQSLANRIAKICRHSRVWYRTLSHREEAILIRDAVSDFPDKNIVNAGGGSIQIIDSANLKIHLLSFGITDLNLRFQLQSEPEERKIRFCIEWIENQLPAMNASFVYTGGEEKYLSLAKVPLLEGVCTKSDFETFSDSVDSKSIDELRTLSPFDSEWMAGAVASNCIVRALLRKSRSEEFVASDLNIAHGLVRRLLQHGFDERFD